MNELEPRLLRAFLVLMAERSVTRAADRLEMSQPAISHVLARLRAAFDDPLLLRSRGGMVPTNRALALEGRVRELLASYEQLMRPERQFDPARSERRFVITAPEYAEHLLMPALMRSVRTGAPGIRIDVRVPDADRAYELLESGEVDLRIAWLLHPMPSLRSLQLFQDRMVYIADRDHPLIRGRLGPTPFFQVPHVRTQGNSVTTTNRVIDDALERAGRALAQVFYLQNFLTIPSTLAGTDAIAALPLRLAERFARQHPLQVLESPLKLPRIRYAAYWHERSQNDPGHRWLRQTVQRAAQALASSAA